MATSGYTNEGQSKRGLSPFPSLELFGKAAQFVSWKGKLKRKKLKNCFTASLTCSRYSRHSTNGVLRIFESTTKKKCYRPVSSWVWSLNYALLRSSALLFLLQTTIPFGSSTDEASMVNLLGYSNFKLQQTPPTVCYKRNREVRKVTEISLF